MKKNRKHGRPAEMVACGSSGNYHSAKKTACALRLDWRCAP